MEDAARWRKNNRKKDTKKGAKARDTRATDESDSEDDLDGTDEATSDDDRSPATEGRAAEAASTLPPALSAPSAFSPRTSVDYTHASAALGAPGSLPQLQSPRQRRGTTCNSFSDLEAAGSSCPSPGPGPGPGSLAWGLSLDHPQTPQHPQQYPQQHPQQHSQHPHPPGYPNPHPHPHQHPFAHPHPRTSMRLQVATGFDGAWGQPSPHPPAAARSPKGLLSGGASPATDREYGTMPTTPSGAVTPGGGAGGGGGGGSPASSSQARLARSRSRGPFSPQAGLSSTNSSTSLNHGAKLLHVQAAAGPPRAGADLHAVRTPMPYSGAPSPPPGTGTGTGTQPPSRRSSSFSGGTNDPPLPSRRPSNAEPWVAAVAVVAGGSQSAQGGSSSVPHSNGSGGSAGSGGSGEGMWPAGREPSRRRMTGTSRRGLPGPDERVYGTPPDPRSSKSATTMADRASLQSSGGPRPKSRQLYGATSPGAWGQRMMTQGSADYGARQRQY